MGFNLGCQTGIPSHCVIFAHGYTSCFLCPLEKLVSPLRRLWQASEAINVLFMSETQKQLFFLDVVLGSHVILIWG